MEWTPSGIPNRTIEEDKPGSGNKHGYPIQKLRDLFTLLGTDPTQNIHAIVRHTGEVFDGAMALYHRLDERPHLLSCWSGHKLPPDFPTQTTPEGHICYEATIKGEDQPVILEDISQTPFQQSDPCVAGFGLKSYLGFPVRCQQKAIGALAIADIRVRRFNEDDVDLITALAKALSLEEERLHTDAMLHQSKSRYQELYKTLRLLTDNVPDLIWAKDLQDRYLFVNQAVCDKLLKCPRPDDAIGRTDTFFADQEREAGHRHTFGRTSVGSDEMIKKTKKPGRFLEAGLVRNHHLVLDVHKAPFWGPDGEIIGTVGCGRDLTKEKQTEEALRKSERRYRDLYHNTPVMLSSMDSNNIITSASNLWLDTLGYERGDVIGRNFLDFFTPQSRKDALDLSLPEFYRRGQMKNKPFQLLTRDGETRHVLLSAIRQNDDMGHYDGALTFAVDVTEAKRAEMENSRLSSRLQQAQKMEAIATLAGGVAHQFNNALAVILGNLELIQMDGLLNAKLAPYLKPMNQSGQKMVQLTGQLLAYARGGKFQTQVVSAHRFVSDTLKIVQHSMAPYVEVETDLDENTGHIEVDLTQMQMLLAAVLSNASEAMPGQGRVRITLKNAAITEAQRRKHPELKEGRQVLLQIEDDGEGMDEETRSRIFEPFFTTKFQGRGLGMAAVYGIVKKHGGYIYVDSAPGKGTKVIIYLPVTRFTEEVAEKVEPYVAKKQSTALIVEDEPLVMEVNSALVQKLGYHVLEARTGREAVEVVTQYEGEIDFVLLDVILPDMDGSLIYPRIMEKRPDLKVVVCSGFALDGPARDILEAGAQSFIQKPFTIAALSAVLKKIFND